MDRYRDLGITTSREDVDRVGANAYMTATGASFSDCLDRHERED